MKVGRPRIPSHLVKGKRITVNLTNAAYTAIKARAKFLKLGINATTQKIIMDSFLTK